MVAAREQISPSPVLTTGVIQDCVPYLADGRDSTYIQYTIDTASMYGHYVTYSNIDLESAFDPEFYMTT
jgi:hypothetical protein